MAVEQAAGVLGSDRAVEFILEPVGRNTAPAIALACLGLDPNEIALVVASDHLIENQEAYLEAVGRARGAAERGYLVTFGLKPEYPEIGYGYIGVEDEGGCGYRRARAFKEKPDSETARRHLESGRYCWNSGMFCFRAGRLLEELDEQAPAILDASR